MIKYFTCTLLSLFFLSSCSRNPAMSISHIDGYWEIESVTLSNGSKRDYNINQTIDYISINDSLIGFRKKLKPLFDGSFETSNDVERLHLKIENDSLNVYYETPYSTWKETILLASKQQLKVVNQNNDVYLYKRFTPINTQ